MLLTKNKTAEIHTTGRIVKASEIAAIADAQQVIQKAEDEAARILSDAKAEFERQKALGYQTGINAGKLEIAQQKMMQVESSVKFMESVEDKMVDLVMKALRKCVETIGDKEMVVQIVHKAMTAVVRNQKQITIRVAPDMVSVVKGRLEEILSDFPSVNYAEVVEDSKLVNQACVLETEAGVVDATIDVQLEAIEKSIRKQFPRENG